MLHYQPRSAGHIYTDLERIEHRFDKAEQKQRDAHADHRQQCAQGSAREVEQQQSHGAGELRSPVVLQCQRRAVPALRLRLKRSGGNLVDCQRALVEVELAACALRDVWVVRHDDDGLAVISV